MSKVKKRKVQRHFCSRGDKVKDLSYRKQRKAWHVAPWWNTCLACTKPWASAPALQNKEAKDWEIRRKAELGTSVGARGRILFRGPQQLQRFINSYLILNIIAKGKLAHAGDLVARTDSVS